MQSKTKQPFKISEKQIVEQFAKFIKSQYPKIDYRIDIAADMKLTMGQAVRNKKIQSGRGYPDIFFAEPKGEYCGLYIEVKTCREDYFLKDGVTLKSSVKQHMEEQIECLSRLSKKGYCCVMAFGIDECINSLNGYMDIK